MKKVWILERYVTVEEMQEQIDFTQECINKALKEKLENMQEIIDGCDEVLSIYTKKLIECPNGYWCGHEGKSNYKQFCWCAKAAMRRNDENGNNFKFRVVEGEIPDDATMWPGYKFVKVNEGVMKYLLATYK